MQLRDRHVELPSNPCIPGLYNVDSRSLPQKRSKSNDTSNNADVVFVAP
ncbi:hypothetical protein CKA32_002101 [Geitlerinema sp. FC II]|nr:hypothetical protein CKA32_002101 [Geitlerinema sp. FC II]